MWSYLHNQVLSMCCRRERQLDQIGPIKDSGHRSFSIWNLTFGRTDIVNQWKKEEQCNNMMLGKLTIFAEKNEIRVLPHLIHTINSGAIKT